MFTGLADLKWYSWIAVFGAGLVAAAFFFDLPEFDNAAVLLGGVALFFFGVGESTCHTTQTSFIGAEFTPSGVGPGTITKPIRAWSTEGRVLYTIGALAFLAGVGRILLVSDSLAKYIGD